MANLDRTGSLSVKAVVCREAKMVNQGRLIKVMFLLMGAMTVGTLILLALAGKPIQPMRYSLTSQIQTPMNSIHDALKTEAGIELGRWRRIEVCCEQDEGRLSSRFGPTGKLAVNYHFVISGGQTGSDGRVYSTDCWLQQLAASAGSGQTIKICLLSPAQSGSKSALTSNQSQQLITLVNNLRKICRIKRKVNWKNS